MNKNLPVYELRIDENKGTIVNAIALVDEPAIEIEFLAFNNNQLFFQNDEKQELIGAAMVPDMKIYRRAKTGEEYYVYFTKETIRQIAQLYFKKGFQNNLNIEHSTLPAGSYIYQSYITDSIKGILPPKGMNVPDGSWIIGVKVEDKGVWNEVKMGNINGFSMEGLFQFVESNQTFNKFNDIDDKELLQLINKVNNILINKK